MNRMTRDEYHAQLTKLVAKRSTCPRKRVGALLVKNNRVISTGYNGSPSGMPHCDDVGCEIGPHGGCQRTVHAEANAIAFAAKEGISTDGAILYLTMEPCLSCAKLIINAGIREVYCLGRYRDPSGINLLVNANIGVYYPEEE